MFWNRVRSVVGRCEKHALINVAHETVFKNVLSMNKLITERFFWMSYLPLAVIFSQQAIFMQVFLVIFILELILFFLCPAVIVEYILHYERVLKLFYIPSNVDFSDFFIYLYNINQDVLVKFFIHLINSVLSYIGKYEIKISHCNF